MQFSRSQPRSVLYPGETVLLQKHLLKQRHHKQILRFRHHLVRTLLLLCCHLIQTLCWQRYQGQVPLPGYNRHISICHIFEACKPLRKLREQRTLHCSLTIPLQHLSVTSIESLCKSFFSNSPTKQLLLLLLLGLKHDVLTLKGNFAKQAEPRLTSRGQWTRTLAPSLAPATSRVSQKVPKLKMLNSLNILLLYMLHHAMLVDWWFKWSGKARIKDK